MHRFMCKPVDSCAGVRFMIFYLWFQFSMYFNLINFIPFSSDSFAYFVMLLYFFSFVWQSCSVPFRLIPLIISASLRLRWLFLFSNTCRHPCFVRLLPIIIQYGLWLFSHRYLIYGYTRPKVNNTNAFHNNSRNVTRNKQLIQLLLIFESLKMIIKFSTAKEVKVRQFLSL